MAGLTCCVPQLWCALAGRMSSPTLPGALVWDGLAAGLEAGLASGLGPWGGGEVWSLRWSNPVKWWCICGSWCKS